MEEEARREGRRKGERVGGREGGRVRRDTAKEKETRQLRRALDQSDIRAMTFNPPRAYFFPRCMPWMPFCAVGSLTALSKGSCERSIKRSSK